LGRFQLAVLAVLVGLASTPLTRAQVGDTPAETPAPTTAPRPLDQLDPLRSPYHTVQFFLIRVAEAERNTAAYADAMRCLDLAALSPAEVEERGPALVDDLAAILAALRAADEFDREKLPQTPAPELERLTIGPETARVELARAADGRWHFAVETVARIPELLAALRDQAVAEAGEGAAAASALRQDTSSVRATMNMFLTAMNENDLASAVRCLDLSRLSPARQALAPILAGKLWLVLNRHEYIVLQDLPDETAPLDPYDVLKHTAGRIAIDRVRTGPREGEWLFTAATVHSIEPLYEAFEDRPVLEELKGARVSFWRLPALYVREYVVPPALKRPLWGLQVWQWAGLGASLLAALVLRELCSGLLPRAGRLLLRTEGVEVLPRTLRAALRPISTLVLLATIWGGFQFLDLGAEALAWLAWTLRIGLVAAAVFACYRVLDLMTSYLSARAARGGWRLDDVLLPLVHKTLKVLVLAFGFVFIARAFGFEVAPLLAGLGLGGLAFGLAAQDTLKNFFGSVNVVLDRPFQVGDWIKIGDVEGTVEAVGLRSSRIRTAYDSLVTVPNSELMTAKIDNLGRRRYRRTTATLAVPYATPPEQLEAFCEGVREIIRQHPYTRKDNFQVYVHNFGPSAIEIQLSCFHETPDWKVEMHERHRLLLDIVRLARRLGVEFAYPTRTIIHVQPDEPPPTARPRDVAARPAPVRLEQALDAGRAAAVDIVAASTSEPQP
jgi:MscS family membrane protein